MAVADIESMVKPCLKDQSREEIGKYDCMKNHIWKPVYTMTLHISSNHKFKCRISNSPN